MIEEGYSEGQKLVLNLLKMLASSANGKAIVTWDEELRELLKTVIHNGRTDRLEKCLTIQKVAKRAGWHVGDGRVLVSQIGMGNKMARLISNHRGAAQMGHSTYEEFREIVVPLPGAELMAKVQENGFL
jgi:hypothetical protein